jgi:hypothetical protein
MPFATYVGNAWRSVTIIIAILGVELNALGLEDIFWATLAPTFIEYTRYSMKGPNWYIRCSLS